MGDLNRTLTSDCESPSSLPWLTAQADRLLVRSGRWLDSVLATLPTIASDGGLLGEGMEQT